MTHKILAIDDHELTLEIVVLTLERHGYEVVSSLSPIEGLQLAKDEQPDLILLDVSMPEMDGLEVCRRMRADSRLTAVPIIMFTAEDEPYQKAAGFDAGADDYLTKPTDPDEMIARIEGILGNIEESFAEEAAASSQVIHKKTVAITPNKDKGTNSMPGKLIAIVGARGGAGATLTAVNLAASIVQSGHPTTLVDLDMVQGHISLYLNQKLSGSINTLAGLPAAEIGQMVSQQFIKLGQHLRLLLTHPNQDGRFPRLSLPQTETLLDTLQNTGQHIVFDIGHDISDVHQLVLNRADQIIVCLSPERIAFSTAKKRISDLQNKLQPFTTLDVIIFDVGNRMNLPQKAIETYLGHTLQAVISIPLAELTQSVNRGAIFVKTHEQSKTTRQFYQLAKQIIQV